MTTKTLTVGEAAVAGLAFAPAALGASDTAFEFANDGATLLFVENGSAGTITVTVDVPNLVDGLTITDPTVSITAGASKCIGPFKPRYFNNSSGLVTATINSPATTIKGQAIHLPRI